MFTETYFGTAPVLAALDAHPEALDLFLRHGLDPNLRVSGVPLVFKVKAIETARRLVAAGADPSVTSDAGLSMLEHREREAKSRYRPLSADDRAAWTQLMGQRPRQTGRGVRRRHERVHVAPAPVVRQEALDARLALGSGRWPPVKLGGRLRLGEILGHHMPQALRALVAPISDSASQDLLWLSQLRSPDGTTAPPPVSPARLCDAVRNWVDLDRRLLQHTTLHAPCARKKFVDWVELAPDPATREVVLDHWLAWHESDPSRWKNVSSFCVMKRTSPPPPRWPLGRLDIAWHGWPTVGKPRSSRPNAAPTTAVQPPFAIRPPRRTESTPSAVWLKCSN